MVVKLLSDKINKLKIFKRNKKSLEIKVITALKYISGLSYRAISNFFRNIGIKVSKSSAQEWVSKIEENLGKIIHGERKERGIVAIDETKLKLNGKVIFVYSAIDIKTKEIIAIRAFSGRSYIETLVFLREILSKCKNKPLILVDRAPWYSCVLERIGLKYQQVSKGPRNYIERWFRTLKERTKRFYNNFRSRELNLKNVNKFLRFFVFWYNYLRIHLTLGRSPCSLEEGVSM